MSPHEERIASFIALADTSWTTRGAAARKQRHIRAMDPILRMAMRFEFLTYLQNVVRFLVDVCDLVTVAKMRGYLRAVPQSRGAVR